jgi:peptide deformylase
LKGEERRMFSVTTTCNGESLLRSVSSPCVFDEQLKEDIKTLKDFCGSFELYSISAIQLGIPKRMIYIKTTSSTTTNQLNEKDEERLYINPIILSKRGKTKYWEICVSCVDENGIRYGSLVTRPYEIEIEYQNMAGGEVHETLTGLAATIFCHEYDHLNGILQMDRAEKNIMIALDDRWKLRKEEPYQIISKDCEWEEPNIKEWHP